MTHGVNRRHPVLPPQSKLIIPKPMPRRNHAAVSGRYNLSGMERKASRITVRLSDLFPVAVPQNLATDCAGCILDQRERVFAGNCDKVGKIAWHAHLVHADDGPCGVSDRRLHKFGSYVEGGRTYIYKHRDCTAISNAICRCDKGMADRDYLISGAHSCRE